MGASETVLTPLPMFHMNALGCTVVGMLLTGGTVVPLDRFHARRWWRTVKDSGATVIHYLGVMPAMLIVAEPSPDDRRHSVRWGFGAGVDGKNHAPFEARFGFPLIEAWAMTETGGGVVIVANQTPRRLGMACFGRPDADTECRIVREDGTDCTVEEPGELLVRRAGPDPRHGFFREYLKDPEATAEAWADGWFHTGDVVRRDAEGLLYFVDRKKNVIRRSGENIAAVEVEGVLLLHPNVAAAACAAAPDPVRGDEVFACIVPREKPADEAARRAMAAEIVEHCLSRLAYYKAPGYVAFLDALPVTATQKIQRGTLKQVVADMLGNPDVVDTRAMKSRRA
jgi:acyl-CoA synthetase (AMP-forming)/AMP-acid ligase II